MARSGVEPSAGVVLTNGRTRVWVERGVLHWRRGRTTVVVPGTQIRRVEAVGRSLTVLLVEDAPGDAAMTVRHRRGDVIAALGAEIAAVIKDADPLAERRSVRVWPLRVLARMRDRVVRGSPWWRRALGYVVVGLPAAVWLPVEPGFLGLAAWLTLPAGVALLRLWVAMAELDTRWVMWRRGSTVRARFELDLNSEDVSYVVHFRTLDGRDVTARPPLRGRGDVIRYDPRNPERVLVPTRVAWVGIALAAFLVTGFWGVFFAIPKSNQRPGTC